MAFRLVQISPSQIAPGPLPVGVTVPVGQVTSGQIAGLFTVGAAGGPRAEIGTNVSGESGIRLYSSALNETVKLDAATGNATYKGSVIIQGTNGLFVYKGTPGAGTLIGSIAATAGTDSFGNVYGQGVGVESGLLTMLETVYSFTPPVPPAGYMGLLAFTDGSIHGLDHSGNYGLIANPAAQAVPLLGPGVTNTTVETVIASMPIPKLDGPPDFNNNYEIECGGDISTDVSPGNFVVRLRIGGLGGTNICTAGAVTPASGVTTKGISFRGVVNLAAAGSGIAGAIGWCTTASEALPTGVVVSRSPSTGLPINVPDNAAQTLVMTFQWFTAKAANDLNVYVQQGSQIA